MRKTLISIIIICLLFIPLSSVPAYPLENEPGGFRGIIWGAEFSILEDEMSFAFADEEIGGIRYYSRNGDEMKIGEAALKGIYYGFLRGKFCSVRIETRGRKNYDSLKDEFIRMYGTGTQIKGSLCTEKYYWFGGEITTMLYEQNNCAASGILYLSSKEFLKKQEKKRW